MFLAPDSPLLPAAERAAKKNIAVERWIAVDPFHTRTFSPWWLERYSPDQPRDEHGRFTSGGDTSVAERESEHEATPEEIAQKFAVHLADDDQPGLSSSAEAGYNPGVTNPEGDYSAAIWNETARETTGEQNTARQAWSQPGQYKAINEWARGEAPVSPNEAVTDLSSKVAALDQAIDRQAPTTADTTLYRFVTEDHASAWTDAAPDTRLTEPGFMGTTPDFGTAVEFPGMAGYEPGGAILEIHAPAGTQGMAGPYSESRYGGFREVALPRGAELQISDLRPDILRGYGEGEGPTDAFGDPVGVGNNIVRVDLVGQ